MHTHHNNALRQENIGERVVLKGFVAKKRDLGNLVFIDLRDSEGITQLAFYKDNDLRSITTGIKNEYVLEAEGVVRERSSKNPDMPTGDIEVDVDRLEVLNTAKQPPLLIQNDTDALEETRLRYRYLDLRRPKLQELMKLRHRITKATRDFLSEEDFLEFETPILTKSTPEGARDYIVPSRLHKHTFYALPQSPQIFKQLLMISGFERYYQIARCFRDEDLRSDRQPEFTQIDIEMAFVDEEKVLDVSERLIKRIMKDARGIDVKTPFPRISYEDAMRLYGTDKPDLRFGMAITDLSAVFKDTAFKIFKGVLSEGGAIQAINAEGAAKEYSRKQIDALETEAKKFGAKGLAYLKYEDGALAGPPAKFLEEEELAGVAEATAAGEGDLILIVADTVKTSRRALGHLRNVLAEALGLIDADIFDFTWVVNWPLFEYDEEEGRYLALHHPFTRVRDEDKDRIEKAPGEVLAYGYDLVAQGQELGGGSMRIHEMSMQRRVFEALGIDEATQQSRFGFLLEALEYGTPPHGGIAFGLDRIVMMLGGTDNIRDVIPFPKTQSGHCLLTGAPDDVDTAQLEALALKKSNHEK